MRCLIVSSVFLLLTTIVEASSSSEKIAWRGAFVTTTALIYATNLFSADSMGIEYGNGEDMEFTRGVARWLHRKDVLKFGASSTDIYWQVTYGKWQSSLEDSQEVTNNVIGFSPVFRLELPFRILPHFIETSVGMNLFSRTELNGKDFGGNFQFEDTLALGWDLGADRKWELVGKFTHYSNNSIKVQNAGINFPD